MGIWIEGVSYAGVSNSVSLDLSADVPEATVFKGEVAAQGGGRPEDHAFSLEGFFDRRPGRGAVRLTGGRAP